MTIPNQPPGGQYPPPPPGGQYPPPPPGGHYPPPPGGPYYPPPKKRHRVRNSILGALAAIVLIIVIVAVANSGKNSGYNSPSVPAAKDSTPAAAASSASAVPATPAAAFKAATLLDTSGSGNYDSPKFTVGGSGNYDVYWSFTNTDGSNQSNFALDADGMGGDQNFNGPDYGVSPDHSGVTHVYNDAGTHYLTVMADACNWTLKVVTAK